MDTGKSALGLDGNVAAALGYPIGIIAIICLVMEKDSRVAAAIVRGVSYAPATAESGVKRMIRRPFLFEVHFPK